MFALGLLTCVVLRAFSAQAEVVNTFYLCREFFYQETKPRGMDQNANKICQMYGEGQPMHYYATLYSTQHRIPLYSAYIFDPDCSSDKGRKDIWHVEPQISGYPIRNMVREGDLRNLALDEDVIKRSQAVSSDYSFSGYDRGHLNPNSFSCGAGRTATFTLTNAAPMDPCFNRGHWGKWERHLRSFLLDQLSRDGNSATVYIVTGTVPNANLRIPQKENSEGYEKFSEDYEEFSEGYERVSVPSHIWTAVCYKHHFDDRKSLSFAYMGENQPEEPGINLMSVSDLNYQLSMLYSKLSGTPQTVTIFVDGCFEDEDKLNKVKEKFKKLINIPGKQVLQMSTAVQTTFSAVNSISSTNKVGVKEMTVKLAFENIKTYYIMSEDLKVSAGSACLISNARPRKHVHEELRKRDVSEWPGAVECLLVPEKQRTAADGSQCSSVSESRDSCRCTSGRQTKPCCSSPCLYQHHLKGYWCNSGQTLIKCSPRYSLVTANGERCLDDHPCATYGYNYYWCKTGHGFLEDDWGYCSPPLWSSKAKNGKFCRSDHACAKYDEDYMWCYTDDEGNYDKCCTSDDCSSAVSGQTCRSNHMCGYHGKSYLWCYTDNRNNWDYCCKDCA